MTDFVLKNLPPNKDLETKEILKQVNIANRELAGLNAFSRSIPNRNILINALTLQEAKDSSEIECIITTHDELYRAGIFKEDEEAPQTKEVRNYAQALNCGFQLIQKNQLLTTNHICKIQSLLEENNAGIRKHPGTVLQNSMTNEIVYTPPQEHHEILSLLKNLERFINDDEFWPDVDPLIKMAVIHYQFESIHPFYDGNGRTGRILNVLYLVLKNLLDAPVLYLSRYIIYHKSEYYELLKNVSRQDDWENFVLFMLKAIESTSRQTTRTIQVIHESMQETKEKIRNGSNIYSRELLENLFLHPYTRIGHLQTQLEISRNTATSYLNKLTELGILQKVAKGRNLYFINTALFQILTSLPEFGEKKENGAGQERS